MIDTNESVRMSDLIDLEKKYECAVQGHKFLNMEKNYLAEYIHLKHRQIFLLKSENEDSQMILTLRQTEIENFIRKEKEYQKQISTLENQIKDLESMNDAKISQIPSSELPSPPSEKPNSL
jgi:hypothetical protein